MYLFFAVTTVSIQRCGGLRIVHTSRSSAVSTFASVFQWRKYSSTAAFCAVASFFIIALKPPLAFDDSLCIALLKAASREWSSCSSLAGAIVYYVTILLMRRCC